MKEHFEGILWRLKTGVDIHVAGTGTKQEMGGFWKYQLISRDLKRVINKTSTYLKSVGDYDTLVRRTRGEHKDTPIAVLTQVCPFLANQSKILN